MWLFTGKYAGYGMAICEIALGATLIAIIFAVLAARLTTRAARRSASGVKSDHIIWGVTILAAGAVFGEMVGFGQQVFIPGYGLNKGFALILAVIATLLGLGAIGLPRRLLWWRVLPLVLASGLIFGDVAGWLRRSTEPSKLSPQLARKLFRLDHGVWTAAPAFADQAQFAVSNYGVLWTLDSYGQLSRLEGERWTHFDRTEIRRSAQSAGGAGASYCTP